MVFLQSKYDSYKLIEITGKGTFGEVWKAWQGSTGNLVAIKKIMKDFSRNFIVLSELNMLKAIEKLDPEQSHIIRFITCFKDKISYYMVFEFLHLDLFQYQKMNGFAPVPVRYIRTIASQVLKALAKLKEISVIHADLKPQNIMLIDQDKYPFKIKLIDFGNANYLSEVKHLTEPYMQTRFYRAPEILLGLQFNERIDVWSLGCIMAELHLGCPLYPGSNEYDQIRYICDTQGLPQSYLLDAASKSLRFFHRWRFSNGTSQWTIKTKEEYQLETGVTPLETRKFIFGSLDKIATTNTPKSSFPDHETVAEYYDQEIMVGIIKKMLTWDSNQRISANAATTHPFITLHHLKVLNRNTKYFQLAQQCPYSTTRNNPTSRADDKDLTSGSFPNPDVIAGSLDHGAEPSMGGVCPHKEEEPATVQEPVLATRMPPAVSTQANITKNCTNQI
ncbi:homeodomain-interacting protein kinase 4 [Hyperolius riggenbachi]|uniref:homeodomain-interacting protein kinase 4 n=1 Tax=Hyperolius riggenbachi TaxID=752182 RepID=UPI0035A27D68